MIALTRGDHPVCGRRETEATPAVCHQGRTTRAPVPELPRASHPVLSLLDVGARGDKISEARQLPLDGHRLLSAACLQERGSLVYEGTNGVASTASWVSGSAAAGEAFRRRRMRARLPSNTKRTMLFGRYYQCAHRVM